MPLEKSHGKLRPESPRPEDIAKLPGMSSAAASAVDRCPKTGQFLPGNAAHSRRRRDLKARGKRLLTFDPEQVQPWLQPYLELGRKHLADLLKELPEDVGANALALAEEVAAMRAVARGLLALGAAGDKAALKEARSWLQQARQHCLTFEALVAADMKSNASNQDTLSWLTAGGDSED